MKVKTQSLTGIWILSIFLVSSPGGLIAAEQGPRQKKNHETKSERKGLFEGLGKALKFGPRQPKFRSRSIPRLPEQKPERSARPRSSPDSLRIGGMGTRTVRTTAYTHSESDHLAYGRKTAAGSTLRATRAYTSAAADWSRYPYGTHFRIEGDPTTYVVDDFGSALAGTGTIDIYKPSTAAMNNWGLRHVDIKVTKWGCRDTSRAMLADRLDWWHCRQMYHALGGKR